MKHAISYAGNGKWLVDGHKGNWATSHYYLHHGCGLMHREAAVLLAKASWLDCARDTATHKRVHH